MNQSRLTLYPSVSLTDVDEIGPKGHSTISHKS